MTDDETDRPDAEPEDDGDAAGAPPPPPGPPQPPGPPRPPGAPQPPGSPQPPGPPQPPQPPQPGGPPAPPRPPAAPPADDAPDFAPGSREALLAALDVFGGLAPALVRTIAEEAEFRAFGARAEVCREGEYTSPFFVLLDGLVGVYKSVEGAPRYLASLGPGDWFGEMSCMSHAPRSATVVAESEAVVLQVPRHVFMRCYADRRSGRFKERIDTEYRERAMENHLRSVALFRGLSRKVLRSVADVAELVVAEKGEAIVAEGEPGDAFYLVRTGHARVTREVDGREEIVAWICENSFFGEVALIADLPRTSSVVAVDRMDLVRIPKAPFLALLDGEPDVRTTVLDRARRLYEEEFLSDEDADARVRARELGTEHEVIKAGDALVIDMSKCTRCNMCVTGCIEAHEDRIPRIGKRGLQYGDLLLTSSCYNCKVPDCMLACKFGAIRRDRSGQVRIDPDACTGCSLCEPACPYGTIHMQAVVDEQGVATTATPNVFSALLGKLGLRRGTPRSTGGGARPGQAADASTRKPLRMAVKCDMCAGRADMACIYNCPCGAIERIDPDILLGSA